MTISYEVGLNCGRGCGVLMTGEELCKFCRMNDSLGYGESPIPLFLTEVLLLSQGSVTLERIPLASMIAWKTVIFWWGMPLSVNSEAFSGSNSSLSWLDLVSQSQTFNSLQCFSELWLGLPFVHGDHRPFISRCQDFLDIRYFSAESRGGHNSLSNKWNDSEMHRVVTKVFEIWHHSLESAHSGGIRIVSLCAYREKQLRQPCAVRWEGRTVWWQAVPLAVLESTQQSYKPAMMTFLQMCEIMLYLSSPL